jgi:glycosyltransferase involved in cell wall biosynthesis
LSQSSVKKKQKPPARAKVCVVVASPLTVSAFLQGHLRALSRVANVTVVADAPNGRFLQPIRAGLNFHSVPIRRAIHPWHDVSAFLALFSFFQRTKFDLVHSYTPKAGLLAMTAAFFSAIPKRVHTFTGQVWATRNGLFRLLLKTLDRLTAQLATHILVDSPSQLRFLRSEGVLGEKGMVLGAGSVSGVDLKRFRANATVRKKIREKLKLKKDEVVFLFVGRLNRDKGIPELYEAFLALRGRMSEARLLLVGPEEERISLPAGLAGLESGVRRVGPSSRPEDFMAAADVLVLPSHREGFGSTVIEAGACGIPALASRIYGLTDAVVHGQTGLLVPCGEVGELTRAMERLGKDKNLRLRMGRAACRRARAKFAQEKITGALLQFYRKMIQVR